MRAIGRSENGLTLLEVMVALGIVAIALTSLLALSTRSIAVHDQLQHLTRGTLLAQQMLSQLEQAPNRFDPERETAFAEPFEEYRWRFRFDDTPLVGVRTVTVTVLWGAESRNESVELTSFVAGATL